MPLNISIVYAPLSIGATGDDSEQIHDPYIFESFSKSIESVISEKLVLQSTISITDILLL